MADAYSIPAGRHRVTTTVSNSRFITTADYADSLETARQIIGVVRDEMPDATHHVYAFRVGNGNSVVEGMSDAGEPTGTAGPPVMAVLRGSHLGDIALVVTRYFGGTKLGKGGLVQAYTEAAQTCLATLQTVRKVSFETIGMDVDYSQYEIVRRLITQYDGKVDEETFLGEVSIIARIADEKINSFTLALNEATNGKIKPIKLDKSE